MSTSYFEALAYGRHSQISVAQRLNIPIGQVRMITVVFIYRGKHRVDPWSNPDHDIMADLAEYGRPPTYQPCSCAMTEASMLACPSHGVNADER